VICKLGSRSQILKALLYRREKKGFDWSQTTNLETQEFKVQEVQQMLISSFAGTEFPFYANQSNYTFPNLNLAVLVKKYFKITSNFYYSWF
jgi:hypothetical protein